MMKHQIPRIPPQIRAWFPSLLPFSPGLDRLLPRAGATHPGSSSRWLGCLPWTHEPRPFGSLPLTRPLPLGEEIASVAAEELSYPTTLPGHVVNFGTTGRIEQWLGNIRTRPPRRPSPGGRGLGKGESGLRSFGAGCPAPHTTSGVDRFAGLGEVC